MQKESWDQHYSKIISKRLKGVLLTILLCLVAIEVPADSWDEGNFKPYNTNVVLEKTNLPILFINTCDEAGHTMAPTTATNYDEEIALMREWIRKQVAWIDEHLGFNPTGIISIQNVPSVKRKDNDDWYDLQGRKFTPKPTARGIYIHQGNKEVIK